MSAQAEIDMQAQHLLANDWHWHFGGRRRGGEFELTCVDGLTIDTVEKFWQSFEAMPSMLALRSRKMNLYFFKSRVKQPLMEDPANVGGGRWVVEHCQMDNDLTDPYKETWMNACLFLIGNDMPERLSESINGIVCNYQSFSKKFRFELWLKEMTPALSKDESEELKHAFMNALERLGSRMNRTSLTYKAHTM
jgi:hypothetical protein